MTDTTTKPRAFRPTKENQQHFQFAEKLKLNVSELLNEVVARHFRRHVEQRAKTMARALHTNGHKLRNGHSKRRAR